MNQPPTVYVVDDNAEMCDSLRWLLESVGTRVQTYPDAVSFLEQVDVRQVGCLILDIRMPGMSGLELQRELNRRGSHLHVIFLSGHADVPVAVRAMREGAVDLFEKPVDEQLLLDRVQAVLRDIRAERAGRQATADFAAGLKQLSPREHDVLERVVRGMRSKEIARDLGVSPRTVEVHRSRIMTKTGAGSVARLVALYKEYEQLP